MFSSFTRICKASINKPKSKKDPIQVIDIKDEDDCQPSKTIEQDDQE